MDSTISSDTSDAPMALMSGARPARECRPRPVEDPSDISLPSKRPAEGTNEARNDAPDAIAEGDNRSSHADDGAREIMNFISALRRLFSVQYGRRGEAQQSVWPGEGARAGRGFMSREAEECCVVCGWELDAPYSILNPT